MSHAGTGNAFSRVLWWLRPALPRLEKRRPLPVDAMIPEPLFASTHAITIDAPPERVWPWSHKWARSSGLVQLGRDRQWRHVQFNEIEPRFQTVGCGDHAGVPGATDAFVVAAVDPPRDLVLTVPDGRGGNAVAWEHF